MNPVEIAALDALDLLVVVDNESDTLSSVDKGVPQLPELGRLVAGVPHLAPKDGHDCVEPWGHLCLACHGFSALVTGRRGSEERSVLFDVGPSAEVWLENARRLGVRLASIEAVCLSHWHADHSGGLPGVVAAISKSRLDEGLAPPIVDLHPDRPDQRGTMTPAGTLVLLNPEPTFKAIGERRWARHEARRGARTCGLLLRQRRDRARDVVRGGVRRAPHGARRAHCAGSLDPRRAIPRGALARPRRQCALAVLARRRRQRSARRRDLADAAEEIASPS